MGHRHAIGYAVVVVALCVTTTGVSGGSFHRHRNHDDFGTTTFTAKHLSIHNPNNVSVQEIHVVFSSHFDAGCKTPGCGKLVGSEPDLCANVLHTTTGEPFAYHIINRYFDEFIPNAVEYGRAGNYTYMLQPWIATMYMDCEKAGLVSWDGIGFPSAGIPTLHCPNETSLGVFREAMTNGSIFIHAFPQDGESSYYPSSNLFEAAIVSVKSLAKDLKIKAPTSVSQRDVPGWSIGTIPLLAKNNINGISFGAGVPPGKPDTANIFVWREPSTGTEVVVTYETAYGDYRTVMVLPNGVALVASWSGDNKGAGTPEYAAGVLQTLQSEYPDAKIFPSTFDAFFDIANQPDVKAALPVVTEDIGDGWIFGVPSDPLKNALFREAARQWEACQECDSTTKEMKRFVELMVKVPEHTWGVALQWFLPDFMNYTNIQFDNARHQQVNGFVRNNSDHADYNTTVNSWIEQRMFITNTPNVVKDRYPEFASKLSSAFDTIINVVVPSTDGFTHVQNPTDTFKCSNGISELQFDNHGGIQKLNYNGQTLANSSHTMGTYRYQTFTEDDYTEFLADFAIHAGANCMDPHKDTDCANFRKPNLTVADPIHRDLEPTLMSLWQKGDDCVFRMNLTLPKEANIMAGAPQYVVVSVNATGTAPKDPIVVWDVVTVAKRPTRLPESIFFSFHPANVETSTSPQGRSETKQSVTSTIADTNGPMWSATVLGTKINPTNVFAHDGVYGGSPHLRGVESVSWKPVNVNINTTTSSINSFQLSSDDVPVVCFGAPSPFPTPRTQAPDLTQGIHYNILQNVWNTNYILWYPFLPEDENIRSRFNLYVK